MSALALGGGIAMALILAGGEGWTSGLTAGFFGALFGGMFFVVAIATSNTISAARVASQCEVSLDAAEVEIPCIRRINGPVLSDRTEVELTEGVLRHIEEVRKPRIDDVIEVRPGKISIVCVARSGARVKANIDISVSHNATVAVLECRPAWRYKRLDGGASWGVAVSLERCVRAALTLLAGTDPA